MGMWTTRSEKLIYAKGLRFTIDLNGRPASYAEVLLGWQEDQGFRAVFNELLADTPFTAFRWETPSVQTSSLTRPFECVVLDAPGLARSPDSDAFAEYFRKVEGDVVAFPNLGGDAIMVVPCPIAELTAYGHLGAFVRFAPQQQQHALWRSIGEAMSRRVSAEPVWLSTAGAGVSWLHVRLDNRPKYYGFEAYRQSA